jgi:hypothetical protein
MCRVAIGVFSVCRREKLLSYFQGLNERLHWSAPSSFMLSGWSSISVASQMIRYILSYLLDGILVSLNWARWPKFTLCSAVADFSEWYSLRCRWNFLSLVSVLMSKFFLGTASRTRRGCCKRLVFSCWSYPWRTEGNDGNPTVLILYLDSTPLKAKRSIDVGSSVDV